MGFISGEYISLNQRFYNIFSKFIIVVFNNILFIGWSVSVFILMTDIFNCTFNLFMNNIVKQPIIDESLFHIF